MLPLRTRWTRTLAATAAVALGAGMSAAGTPAVAAGGHAAAASSATSYDYYSRSVALKSSTHKKLHLSVDAEYYPTESNSESVGVTVSSGSAESHSWSFTVKHKTFDASPAKGTGTIKTRKQLGGFGSITLKLTPDGKAHVTHCGGMTTTSRPVKASGTVHFNTRSTGKHRWGTLGSKHLHFGKSSLFGSKGSAVDDCFNPGCPGTGISYSADNFDVDADTSAFLDGYSFGKRYMITASRNGPVKKGVFRSDTISGHTKKLAITTKGTTASLAVHPTSSNITGSAVLSQSSAPSSTTCKKTVSKDYDDASMASKKLTFHAQVFGNLHFASGSENIAFTRTVKK